MTTAVHHIIKEVVVIGLSVLRNANEHVYVHSNKVQLVSAGQCHTLTEINQSVIAVLRYKTYRVAVHTLRLSYTAKRNLM
jgi:hypothetical protein